MINATLYLKELKRNRKHFGIWLLIIALFTLFVMAFYPSFEQMGGAMEQMMQGLPEGMTRAFGMDVSAFKNILTYYALYYGMHIMVLSSIFTIVMASNIISKEEREGTADFLLTRPLWRSEIALSKLAAFTTYFLLFFCFQVAITVAGFTFIIDEPVNWHKFTILNGYGLMLNICFAGLGFLFSVLTRRGRSVTAAATAMVIGGFIIQALSRISPDTEWIGWISPFKYADFEVIPYNYGWEWWRVLILLGIGLGGIVATFLVFRRKDIYS